MSNQNYPYQGPVPIFLPWDYETRAEKNLFLEYASENFNQCKTGGVFSRKSLSRQESITFSDNHTNEPLLKRIPKAMAKDAILVQKAILHITDVRKSKVFEGGPRDLYKLIRNHEELIDEAYCVLIKQTTAVRGKPFINTMKLTAFIAKFLIPSEELRPYVLSHFCKAVKIAKELDEECYEAACFALIRVNGRIWSHTSVEMTKENGKHAFDDISSESICYSCSIEEVMFHQRKKKPNLCVPYILIKSFNKFFELGAEKTEGIFRLPGSMSHIQDAALKLNRSEQDPFAGLGAMDMATMIKQWFRNIEGWLIPEEFAHENIYKVISSEQIRETADKLPDLAKYTLMYLVGVLRRLAAAKDITNMGGDNLAMTFAMNMSYCNEDDRIKLSQNNSFMHAFLAELIVSWDVSQIYPLPENVL